MEKTHSQLLKATKGLPLIEVILDDPLERSHFQIYRQAVLGAKQANTKYIALCEDDVLYCPEHFKYRPTSGVFAYNLSAWSIFTWGEPMYTHKGVVRRNLNSLICERNLFIEAIEERFNKYPDGYRAEIWSEPGKYENQLGVTVRNTETFYTNPPNIIFSHQNELSFQGLGIRKKEGEYRALDIPYWGKASELYAMYV